MTPSKHLTSILNDLAPALKKKYLKGVKSHGGRLWEKNVGPEITDELLDLIVYVYTREAQVKELVAAAVAVLMLAPGICPREIVDLQLAVAPFLRKNKPHDD
jgi:hypothetical protein